MPSRNVEPEHDPRERYSLYRLCDCSGCSGLGKVYAIEWVRCSECRGEGRVRQEVASCETPEAIGVALVTLAREAEWLTDDGRPCAFGLLDREGEKGKKWLILPWMPSARNVSDAGRVLARSKKAHTG